MKYKELSINILIFIGRKSVFWLLIGLLSALAIGTIELLIAAFIQLFLQSLGIMNQAIKFLGHDLPKLQTIHVIIFLILIGFIRFIAQTISVQSGNFSQEFLNCRLRNLAIHDLLNKSLSSNTSSSDINFRISELFPKAASFIYMLMCFCSLVIQSISVIVIMFLTAWKESIICIIGILIIGFIVLKINRGVRKIAKRVPHEQSMLNSGIEKASKNLLFIRIMNIKNQENKRLSENALNYSSHAIRAYFLNNIATTASPFLGIFLIVSIIFFSQNIWHTQSLTLVAFIYLVIRFVQNLSLLVSNFGSLNIFYPQFLMTYNYYKSLPKSETIAPFENSNLLKYTGEKKSIVLPETNSLQNTNNYMNFINGSPCILINNLSFFYGKLKILENINLNVLSGEQIGIIGQSGTGKSTLLMLILGILSPTNGSILLDNEKPEHYFNNKSIRIGYVGAEPFLIGGTIKENLCFGLSVKQPSNLEIFDALELVQMKSYIESIGLDYTLPEDQSGLSAGQKQRICIARAILNKPTLMILDEASANLDETTELEVALSISKLKGKCTTIIVSHRIGMHKYADKIFSLEKGFYQ
jgi:ABC-type multidrug transport system fused ATPase/permease subunit